MVPPPKGVGCMTLVFEVVLNKSAIATTFNLHQLPLLFGHVGWTQLELLLMNSS